MVSNISLLKRWQFMKLNDPYGFNEIVFTRSARNITFSEAGDEPVRVNVSIDDTPVCSFLMTPISGDITLHLDEILTSLEEDLLIPVNARGDICHDIHVVNVETGGVEWSHIVFVGKSSSITTSECALLTSRPQKARTFKDGIERHVTKWDVPVGGIKLQCRLRFQMGVPQDIMIPFGKPSGSVIEDADVSYAAIRELADNEGYGSERITSYSIRTVYTVQDPPHRYGQWQHFIVCTGRNHQYMFRNHYGAIDTIYAVGQLSRAVDSEVSTFLSDNMEKEVANDAVEKYEQSSGYLVSIEEVRFWSEFFRSKERYVVVVGEIRPIVLDSVTMDAKYDEVNSVKFQWHYSELDTYDEPVRTDEDDITIPGTNLYL